MTRPQQATPDYLVPRQFGIEWHTWLLIVGIYGGWLAALNWYAHGGSWGAVATLAGAMLQASPMAASQAAVPS